MKRGLCLAIALCVVGGLSAGAASARLSPVEQTWVSPVITLYNLEAKALSSVKAYEVVFVEYGGSGTSFDTLKQTLADLAVCAAAMKYAGAPPSTRLVPVDDDMVAACRHLSSGGADLAEAIGDVRAGHGKPAVSLIKASTPQLAAGASDLAAAEHLLVSIGGKSAFEA